MEEFKELYQKAILVTKEKNNLPESINDLLIKDFNEEILSAEEYKALQNYHLFKTKLLSSAKDDDDFADRIKKLRVIANFTNWREFLNYSFE